MLKSVSDVIKDIKDMLRNVEGNRVMFPFTVILDSCDDNYNNIHVSGVEYAVGSDMLYILSDNNAYDADGYVVFDMDWYLIQRCLIDTTADVTKTVIPIYAIALNASVDCCKVYYNDVVVSPFYKTKDEAETKLNELNKLSKEERMMLVCCCTDAGSFTIVEESLEL